MFMKNPHKKETYSFRIKPDLLENIKNYAKATHQTVPELLNNMIEDKIEGLHLTNDYLKEKMGTVSIIGLPPLVDIYNNGNYREFGLFFDNENRVLYEIQRIPNNLDIWDNNKGYTSNKRGTDHEGISFVLAPELITLPEYIKTPELVFCCLIPIYFKVSIKKQSIQVKNISFTNALDKIKNSSSIELMDEFTQYTSQVKEIVNRYSKLANIGYPTPDKKTKAYINLINELKELSKTINKNIIPQLDGAKERQHNKLKNNTVLSDNPYLLLDEIDKLKEENQQLREENKEINQTVKELQSELVEFKKYITYNED